MGLDPHARLAELLGDLAVELEAKGDTESTLAAIVSGAVHIVPGAKWAGISLIDGHHVCPRSPSDPVVSALDRLQSSLNEGPCLSALREHHTVHIEDMAAEMRWPRFAHAAQELGVRSSLCYQLFVEGKNLGALNLYGGQTGVFDEDSFLVGEVLAQHASVALAGASAVSHFRAALASRDVIAQAKGLLMVRHNTTGERAFRLLVAASQEANMKLVDVARWLVGEHEKGATEH